MINMREWKEKISSWDRSLLERQINTLNDIYYEIIDSFGLRSILTVMETELTNRKRGNVKMTINKGMRY